jgi:CRP-like cAMP-binding protein/HEAT repeat protein
MTEDNSKQNDKLKMLPDTDARMKSLKQRVVDSAKLLLKGDDSPLSDKVMVRALPGYIRRLMTSGHKKAAGSVVIKLSRMLSSPNPVVRERAAAVLMPVGGFLVSENHIDVFADVIPFWLGWIRQDIPAHLLENGCGHLGKLARKLIQANQPVKAVPILKTFNEICHGTPENNEVFCKISSDALKEAASDDVLSQLIHMLQDASDDMRETAAKCLAYLGVSAVKRLLSILRTSSDMPERAQVLKIIPQIGKPAAAALAAELEKGGPWYYLRNLILILGRVGGKDHLKSLIPLLKHEDFRVQLEAVNTIYSIGEHHRGKILLRALPTVDDRMKMTIVDMLGALYYEPAVNALITLLNSQTCTAKAGGQLKEKICTALGRIGSVKAMSALQSVVNAGPLKEEGTCPDVVKTAAENAIKRIEDKLPMGTLAPAEPDSDKTSLPAVKSGENNLGDYQDIEDPNNTTIEDTAVGILYKGIVKYAQVKDFEKAEAMREQLIELNPLALTEIIRSGEIIEEERRVTPDIDQDHTGIWADLYDILTPEESQALRGELEEKTYEPDQVIFHQGKANTRLFFVKRGQLKMVFAQENRERLLKTLGRGDVAGEDTFFSISLCTTTLTTLSRSVLFYLNQDVLKKWKDSFPGLELRLRHYCTHRESVQDILKRKGIERRTHKRVKLSGVISLDILSVSGRPIGKTFKGRLADISKGGLSFTVRSPNQTNISLLLGRKLEAGFILPQETGLKLGLKVLSNDPEGTGIHPTGMVIGVSYCNNDLYSIHIKFDNPLVMP